jgi:hypothetical protein
MSATLMVPGAPEKKLACEINGAARMPPASREEALTNSLLVRGDELGF